MGVSWRFARAGGRRRAGTIMVGNAVTTALLLATAAVPTALYPPGTVLDPEQRANLTAVLAFGLVPASVLLIIAGRTSAAVRDRRLASLRMLGLTRARTGVVAAIENGALGLLGALIGLLAFLLLAPTIQTSIAGGPGWFSGPFTTTPVTAVAAVVGTAVLSGLVSTVSLSAGTYNPMARRSRATRHDPSRWRLMLPACTVLTLGPLAAVGGHIRHLQSTTGQVLLLAGAVAGALSIALVTPLFSTFMARLLVRSGSPSGLLAGRAIQVSSTSSARLVAGIGVALYLVIAALAVLSANEATPQYRYALQTIRQGPQPLTISTPLADTTTAGSAAQAGRAPIAASTLAAVRDVPGIQAVFPTYFPVEEAGCDVREHQCASVFVGTCADLARVMVVAGCRDDQAGYIGVDSSAGEDRPSGDDRALATARQIRLEVDQGRSTIAVDLGQPLQQHAAGTQRRWVYTASFNVFVPRALLEAAGARPTAATVIADGGVQVQQAVQRAVAATAPELVVATYPLMDVESVNRVRAVVATLSAIVIGVGLLSLAMTALDRAAEQRRPTAHHIAVGVPARTLRASQLLQTLLPLGVAIVLAAALGQLMVHAFASLAHWPPLSAQRQWAVVLSVLVIGVCAVSAVSLPTVRTHLTPDLLRRE